MPGRKSDIVWLYFNKVEKLGVKGCRAICKDCKSEMQGIVKRMKAHKMKCTPETR